MKHNLIEKLLIIIAWIGLIGGIAFGTLVSKGIFESNLEMSFPKALVVFVGSIFASVAGWAVLMLLVSISNKVRKIDSKVN